MLSVKAWLLLAISPPRLSNPARKSRRRSSSPVCWITPCWLSSATAFSSSLLAVNRPLWLLSLPLAANWSFSLAATTASRVVISPDAALTTIRAPEVRLLSRSTVLPCAVSVPAAILRPFSASELWLFSVSAPLLAVEPSLFNPAASVLFCALRKALAAIRVSPCAAIMPSLVSVALAVTTLSFPAYSWPRL